MKQEDRDLLLRDLSARLTYGVRGKVKADTIVPHKYDIDGFPVETTFDVDVELQRIDVSTDEIFVSTFDNDEDLGNYIEECQIEGTPWTVEEFTPYLRPMSSMTEEEKKYCKEYFRSIEGQLVGMQGRTIWLIDWLNKNHFDYRGLIPMGLAIEVTAENNPYK